MTKLEENKQTRGYVENTSNNSIQLYDKICAQINKADNAKQKRKIAVNLLQQTITTNFSALKANFETGKMPVDEITKGFTSFTDLIIETIFKLSSEQLHKLPIPTEAERLSVLAVGGYGRKEMAPFSDIDLLFLTPYKITPWAESVIESMLYILWDLKLQVGYATRSIEDCLSLGKKDFTIRTTLLEIRLISGDSLLVNELENRLWNDLFQSSATEFTTAKLEERLLRHKKYGENRYLLEPNVKEGKGGLRDLQSLFWIAKYIHHVQHPEQLIEKKVFSKFEFDKFLKASNFIWQVRCHLHFLNNRASEQLNFDFLIY